MKKFIILILITFSFGLKNAQAYQGIDVSAWQGDIDFKKIKNDDIDIVYIRSSVGNSYKDPYFERNYLEAKKNDLKVGFYHFVTARNANEAREQAIFFLSIVKGKEIDCKLAMDFEALHGLSREEVNIIANAFLDTLKEKGYKDLVIYSDLYNAKNVFESKLFLEYPLWLAEYDVEPPSIDSYVGWQYTDRGQIEGISGNVDRDHFREDILLDEKITLKEPSVTHDDLTKIIYYKVKWGDTLSSIALKYSVYLDSLIKDNNIKNPNLIYPNEVLKIKVDYRHHTTGNKKTYKIKNNDNLFKIARRLKILPLYIVIWNNIEYPDYLRAGEELIIEPEETSHLIRYEYNTKVSLKDIADTYNVSIYEIIIINHIFNVHNIDIGKVLYIPEKGIIESP